MRTALSGASKHCAARLERGGDQTLMRDAAKHPDWNLADSCTSNARRVLPRMARHYFALGRAACDGSPTSAGLHRLRLAGKRLRYSLELFVECYGPGLQGHLRSLRTIQDRLGAISDCDATEALLREERLADGEDASLLLAFLDERKRSSTAEFLELWRDEFDAAGKEDAWLEYLSLCPAGVPQPRTGEA